MTTSQTPNWRQSAAKAYSDERNSILARLRSLQNEASALTRRLEELDQAAKVFGLEFPLEVPPVAADSEKAPAQMENNGVGKQFKEVAYFVLEHAYPSAIRAPELQARVEAILKRQFHEKTAGMTLYRFKNEGVVRRDKRLWVFVPEGKRGRNRLSSDDEAAETSTEMEEAGMT